MAKSGSVQRRVIILFTTFLVVGIIGYFVSLIARGYRFDIDKFRFFPNGILVAKSDPDGASIYVNGDLKAATNTNIKLSPNSYNIEVKKEGYITWKKRLTIKKEEVTQITAQLFKTAPSLSPITFDGAENPVVSNDFDKIAYTNNRELWVMSVSSLPIGFPNSPKKIADGITENSIYRFSPDGQELLLETDLGAYLLSTNEFTSQAQRINIVNKRAETLKTWGLEKQKKEEAELKNLPPEIIDLLKRRTKTFFFSPDGTMVMYQALEDSIVEGDLIPKLPGSSTQKEDRDIKIGKKYVYDIKEDRNYYTGKKTVVFTGCPHLGI